MITEWILRNSVLLKLEILCGLFCLKVVMNFMFVVDLKRFYPLQLGWGRGGVSADYSRFYLYVPEWDWI